MSARKLPRPSFSDLRASYKPEPTSVHECSLVDPTKDGLTTSAARMTEALVIAGAIITSRAAITRLGTGQGDGAAFLLGTHDYARFGRLCPHGIARGAEDLAAFLKHSWGAPTLEGKAQATAPAALQGKTGIVAFLGVPGFSRQGHIDLWDRTTVVGGAHWGAAAIWFWEIG